VQYVRPQNRPFQEAGAFMIFDSFFSREKPVVGKVPLLEEETPGQTVWLQLFVIVNVVEITPA